MTVLFALPLILAATLFALWIYYRRELPVRGRGILAGVRALVLALLLLLLWNPSVPGRSASDVPGSSVILLDGSLSMTAIDSAGVSSWERAVQRVREVEGGSATSNRVVIFGDGFRILDEATPAGLAARLEELEPDFTTTVLASALERAAEEGARSVTIVSDLRFQDVTAARDAAYRLGLEVRVEPVGAGVRNAGIADFEVPAGVEAGDSLPVEVVVFGESAASEDSVSLEIREGDRLVGERRLPLPEVGRQSRISLTLPSPEGTGVVEYRATVGLDDDGFPLDDERIAHVTVDPDEGGVVLLSWRPDWEPRFLLPVLEQVTGLTGHGFLRTGEGRYLSMGAGPSSGGEVAEEVLRRRMSRADLLVLHGLDRGAPAWIREAAESSDRLLVFARDREGAGLAGVVTGNPLTGEWYVGADLPPSPVAAALAGVDLTALPPLGDVLPITAEEEGRIVPLRIQLQGRGPVEAAFALQAEGAHRRAVALASGFWRWGFREGPPRQAYRRLWAGVGGWLLGNEPVAGGPGVRPESSVLRRGSEIAWRARGMSGDELALRVLRNDSVVMDTVVRVREDSGFETPGLDPARYRYSVLGEGPDGEAAGSEGSTDVGSGTFQVEPYSDELAFPRREPLPALASDAAGEAGEVEQAGEAVEAGEAGEREEAGDPTGAGATSAEAAASDETAASGETEASGAPGASGDTGAAGRSEAGGPSTPPERISERETRPLRTHPLPFILLLALLCGEWIGRRGRGLR